MRRLLVGLLLGALIFGVAFAGAKVATVTNPMSADLNANSFQVYNAAGYGVNGDETNIGANYMGTKDVLLSTAPGVLGASPLATVTAGTADPNTDPHGAATLYLRRIDSTHAELWFNTGNGWTRLTP